MTPPPLFDENDVESSSNLIYWYVPFCCDAINWISPEETPFIFCDWSKPDTNIEPFNESNIKSLQNNDDNSVFNKFKLYVLPSDGVVVPPIAIEYDDEHLSDMTIVDCDEFINVDVDIAWPPEFNISKSLP